IGWAVWMDNASTAPSGFAVWAVCAKKPKQYAVVQLDFTNNAGSQTSATVQCPLNARGKRLKVLGGGGVGSATVPGQEINTSIPLGGKPRSWRLAMNNNFGIPQAATVVAVCGTAKSWKVIAGTPVASPAGAQMRADASCPTGLVAIGGGLSSTSPSTRVNL